MKNLQLTFFSDVKSPIDNLAKSLSPLRVLHWNVTERTGSNPISSISCCGWWNQKSERIIYSWEWQHNYQHSDGDELMKVSLWQFIKDCQIDPQISNIISKLEIKYITLWYSSSYCPTATTYMYSFFTVCSVSLCTQVYVSTRISTSGSDITEKTGRSAVKGYSWMVYFIATINWSVRFTSKITYAVDSVDCGSVPHLWWFLGPHDHETSRGPGFPLCF